MNEVVNKVTPAPVTTKPATALPGLGGAPLNKPVTPAVTTTAPQNAVSKPADTAKPVTAPPPAAPNKATGDAPKPPVAGQTDDKGASDHAAAIAKANAAAGKPSQGVSTPNPTSPVPTGKQRLATGTGTSGGHPQGGGSTGQGGSISAVKGKKGKGETSPKSQTPREAALADKALVEGFDLSTWLPEFAACKPGLAEIAMVRLSNVAGPLTMNFINLAAELTAGAHQFNVYEIGEACKNAPPRKGNGDHKMNIVRKGLNTRPAMFTFFTVDGKGNRVPVAGTTPALTVAGIPGNKPKACYAVMPTPHLIAIAEKAGVKVPRHMLAAKPADKPKA